MGKAGNNNFIKGVTGKVGVVVIRNSPTGQVVQNLPGRRDKSSKKQEAQNSKFEQATKYGNYIKSHPELKVLYARGINPRQASVFHVAQNDCLISPKIIYIKTEKYTGNVGDLILIKAIDDFKVVSVDVQITNAKGNLIEEGKATPYPRRPKLWRYYATVENPKSKKCFVKVIAKDMPGNKAVMEIGIAKIISDTNLPPG